MKQQEKFLGLSKTFWFNLAVALVALAKWTGQADLIPADTPPEVLIMASALINIFLRIVTRQPVTFRLRSNGERKPSAGAAWDD